MTDEYKYDAKEKMVFQACFLRKSGETVGSRSA